MSLGEIAGLSLTVAVVGAVVARNWLAHRGRTVTDADVRRLDVYARWLAARMTHTRTSISFIAAFRAESGQSPRTRDPQIHRLEAQRARAAWCDAVRALEQAQAELVVWCDEPGDRDTPPRLNGVDPGTLRKAVQGDPQTVAAIVCQLRESERQAVNYARQAAQRLRRRTNAKGRSRARLAVWVRVAAGRFLGR